MVENWESHFGKKLGVVKDSIDKKLTQGFKKGAYPGQGNIPLDENWESHLGKKLPTNYDSVKDSIDKKLTQAFKKGADPGQGNIPLDKNWDSRFRKYFLKNYDGVVKDSIDKNLKDRFGGYYDDTTGGQPALPKIPFSEKFKGGGAHTEHTL